MSSAFRFNRGPVAALGWWDRAPTLHGGTSRCPRLAVRAPTAHGSRPRPQAHEAQPSLLRGPALSLATLSPHSCEAHARCLREHAATRARCSDCSLLRAHFALRARCSASTLLMRGRRLVNTLPARACCDGSTQLRKPRCNASTQLREHANPHASCSVRTLFRTHAAPYARCSEHTMPRAHAATRARCHARTLLREHTAPRAHGSESTRHRAHAAPRARCAETHAATRVRGHESTLLRAMLLRKRRTEARGSAQFGRRKCQALQFRTVSETTTAPLLRPFCCSESNRTLPYQPASLERLDLNPCLADGFADFTHATTHSRGFERTLLRKPDATRQRCSDSTLP